ncbi:MAG: carboxypeptidase regulatory-like domain-containing protein [Planctomycetes bacterium]|nr:carboxypeptidase regulatory-like domain-containing protein [Planctomycetota bacterium]MCB9826636.1 carboxypeptidase regulatory-like domain-containing protein [Planctomycetota bacterium]
MRGWLGWLAAFAVLAVLVLLLADDERAPQVDAPRPVQQRPTSQPGLAPGATSREEDPPRPQEAGEPTTNRPAIASQRPQVALHLEVQNEQGTPLPGSRIECEADVSRMPTLPARMHWVELGTTDDAGVLAIDRKTIRNPLPVRIHHPGYVTTVVQLTRGEPRVVQLPPGRALDGDVSEHGSEAPVVGAVVRAFDPIAEGPYAIEVGTPATTGPGGQFRIEGLPDVPGLLLVATKEPWRPGRAYFQDSWPEALHLRMGGAFRIEGHVTTPRGDPAVDVAVWLLPARIVGAVANRLPWFSVPRASEVWAIGREPTVLGPEGAYAFEGVDPEEPWIVLVAREHTVLVRSKTFTLDPDATAKRVDLVLPAPATVRVRIEDDEGTPIRGVPINLMSPRGRHPIPDREALPFEDGATVFHDVAPGRWEVQAFPEGSRSLHEDVDVGPGDDVRVRLVLASGERLEGTVVYANGRPAIAAAVAWYRGSVHASGETDDEGRFALTGLPAVAGTVEVRVGFNSMRFVERAFENGWDGAEERGYRSSMRLEDVTPGATPLRIVVGRRGTVRGRLAGGWRGRARLHTYSRTVSGGGPLDVEPDGSFHLGAPDPPEGALFVLEHPDGRRAYFQVPELASGADFDVGTVHFGVVGEWRGVVRDPEGVPIRGARIALTERWFEGASTHSDERGVFRFSDLPPRPVWVRLEVPGQPTSFDVVELAGPVTQRDLQIQRAGTLRCGVLAADGTPLSAGELMVRWNAHHPLDADLDDHRFLVRWPGGDARDFLLAPGRWRVTAWASGRREPSAEATVEIRAEQTTEVTLTLPGD